MASVINTNISSLNAQRNLSTSLNSLSTAMQRLSSGLRINSAKDDAAGLAISDRMTSQIRGSNQAARNANDGISLSQTAEGALNEISNNLQRIRELAIQSANATNSTSDRASLDAEAQQLIQEISRVSSQTTFNGLNLLDGTFQTQKFQVGANADQTIEVTSIADSRATALGSNLLVAGGTAMSVNTTAAASTTINGVAIEADLKITTANGGTSSAISYAAGADAKVIAAAINAAAGAQGVTATATNSTNFGGLSAAGATGFNLNGIAISATVVDSTDLTAVLSAINGAAGATGVTATFASTASKANLTLSSSDGRDIKIDTFVGGASATQVTFGTQALVEAAANSSIKTGSVSLASSKGAITLTTANTEVFNTSTSSFSSMASVSLSSAANAQLAIATVDASLAQINTSRGDLGAYQNRFSSAIMSLQTTSENVSASRSRIQDADFAMETANLSRAQILQQAGTAMVAQANQLPQGVLQLLQ